MPELPEVETVRRALASRLEGATITAVDVRRSDLRWTIPHILPERLSGCTLIEFDRLGKHLLFNLDSGDTWMVHLGMSGRFSLYGRDDVDVGGGRHDHVQINLEDGRRLVYTDPRRFGSMDIIATTDVMSHRNLSTLGPDPTKSGFDVNTLAASLQGRRIAAKSALLDQRIIAGVGNIYACEALHLAGISPRRKVSTLVRKDGAPTGRLESLLSSVSAILERAIDVGGSTLRDFASLDGQEGLFPIEFRVYDREGESCSTPGCNGRVQRIVQHGRSTFWCSGCQR
ncbi:MAG TPA: bifunctional DNA-formamidopyrimidine glycosylase/DNA-(apurinic or apyrimidinic site) lyase [Candidatus Poseidoniales archaeon]|nr:bifunctional DNA-formamidopyrimidine glycosylase/DNA-(apurinic or apyrimidinic site) lyase [Candidatus Poseidoniales archaeon]